MIGEPGWPTPPLPGGPRPSSHLEYGAGGPQPVRQDAGLAEAVAEEGGWGAWIRPTPTRLFQRGKHAPGRRGPCGTFGSCNTAARPLPLALPLPRGTTRAPRPRRPHPRPPRPPPRPPPRRRPQGPSTAPPRRRWRRRPCLRCCHRPSLQRPFCPPRCHSPPLLKPLQKR